MSETNSATKEQAGEVSVEQIAERVDRLMTIDRPRYRRLWAYCHNPMRVVGAACGTSAGHERPYRQAQEWGLPFRITGIRAGADISSSEMLDGVSRKEVVIENDIGWRVETMVDYLFGKPLVIHSAAANPQRREIIGELLRQIIAANGGILLLQQLALLGTIYGFVDVLVKFDATADEASACGTQDLGQPPASNDTHNLPDGGGPSDGRAGGGTGGASSQAEPAPSAESSRGDSLSGDNSPTRAASGPSQRAPLARLARMVRLEVVEPARALPFVSCADYRVVEAYGQCYEVAASGGIREEASTRRTWRDLLRRLTTRAALRANSNDQKLVVELITATHWRRYEEGKVVAEGENSLGRVPLVHVQNTAVPFQYGGGSDVEPLIPLQDELNTRLSDRANRITLQSFKMYLGKGVDNFDTLPVAPGRMWVTDNDKADVIEFGGDASSPSEDAHLSDIREAIDKTSGVTPIAAGAIKGRIGRLTSAAALRVTLQALLAKTEKKRTTYGNAIGQMCELALAWLDRAGVFHTTSEERRVELNWPSPLPENEIEKLTEAEIKSRLGVPKEILIRELGY